VLIVVLMREFVQRPIALGFDLDQVPLEAAGNPIPGRKRPTHATHHFGRQTRGFPLRKWSEGAETDRGQSRIERRLHHQPFVVMQDQGAHGDLTLAAVAQ
jgi:hypothetical protein